MSVQLFLSPTNVLTLETGLSDCVYFCSKAHTSLIFSYYEHIYKRIYSSHF